MRRPHEIYPAVEELIDELRLTGAPKLSAVLEHRMHTVCWTTNTELFEELTRVLSNAIQSPEEVLSDLQIKQIERILRALR